MAGKSPGSESCHKQLFQKNEGDSMGQVKDKIRQKVKVRERRTSQLWHACWWPAMVPCPPYPPSGCLSTDAYWAGKMKQSPEWVGSVGFWSFLAGSECQGVEGFL